MGMGMGWILTPATSRVSQVAWALRMLARGERGQCQVTSYVASRRLPLDRSGLCFMNAEVDALHIG